MKRAALRSGALPQKSRAEVALSPELWQIVLEQSEQYEQSAKRTQIAVCLSSESSSRRSRRGTRETPLQSVISWACLDEDKQSRHANTRKGVSETQLLMRPLDNSGSLLSRSLKS